MRIAQLIGDDEINMMASSSMCATVSALVEEGLIPPIVADQFLKSHICILVTPESGLGAWMKGFFGKSAQSRMVCFKASATTQPTTP